MIASSCIPEPGVVDFNGEEDEYNSAERLYYGMSEAKPHTNKVNEVFICT